MKATQIVVSRFVGNSLDESYYTRSYDTLMPGHFPSACGAGRNDDGSGYSYTTSDGHIWTSPDGITWTRRTRRTVGMAPELGMGYGPVTTATAALESVQEAMLNARAEGDAPPLTLAMPEIENGIYITTTGAWSAEHEALPPKGAVTAREVHYEIKWKDKTYGTNKHEKWVNISKSKVMAMLKRFHGPEAMEMIEWRLRNGDDIDTPNYSVREVVDSWTEEHWGLYEPD